MMSFIIQQSLDNALPFDWRKALVKLMFKKETNPIQRTTAQSPLPACCKIVEHIIDSQVMTHLDNHGILVDCQHGFRRKRSCETQLLITSHDLAEILNNHSQADVAVLDFSKAFDKVPHTQTPPKTQVAYYNLDRHVIGWVESLLSSRTQRVMVVDGFTSQETPVLSGVPQGTVPGPLLFLVFI